MIPGEVRSAASSADLSDLPPTVQAANMELAQGMPTVSTAAICASFHAQGIEHPPTYEALGGHPGFWWSASVVPAMPQAYRSPAMETWAAEVLASAPAEIRANVSGSLRPAFLVRLDERRRELDVELRAQVQGVLEATLSDALRRCGVQVMASVRDPEQKANLQRLGIEDVLAAAQSVQVTPGRTLTAAVGLDITQATEKALEAQERALRDALRKGEAALLSESSRMLGVTVRTTGQKQRFDDAVRFAGERMRALLARRLADPNDPAPELGERSSGRVPGAIAFDVISVASGARHAAEVTRDPATGMPLASNGRAFAGTLSTRPGYVAAIAQALRTGEPQNVRANLTPEAEEAAAAVANAQVTQVTRWRHGAPEVPFPPHEALDGKVAGTEEFEALATSDYHYVRKGDNTIQQTPAFSLGRWYPGDHEGCTCWWETDTSISFADEDGTVAEPIPDGPMSAEDYLSLPTNLGRFEVTNSDRLVAGIGVPSMAEYDTLIIETLADGTTVIRPAGLDDSDWEFTSGIWGPEDGALGATMEDQVRLTIELAEQFDVTGATFVFDPNAPLNLNLDPSIVHIRQGQDASVGDVLHGIAQYEVRNNWTPEQVDLVVNAMDHDYFVAGIQNQLSTHDEITVHDGDLYVPFDPGQSYYGSNGNGIASEALAMHYTDTYFGALSSHGAFEMADATYVDLPFEDLYNTSHQAINSILNGTEFEIPSAAENATIVLPPAGVNPYSAADANASPVGLSRRSGFYDANEDWHNGLNPSQKAEITEYTGSGYGYINRRLRAGDSVEELGYSSLQEAILQYPPHIADIVQYRSVVDRQDLDFMAEILALQPGDGYVEQGFGSWAISGNEEIPEGAAVGFGSTGNNRVLALFRLESNRGAVVDSISSNRGEQEILQPAGAQYEVLEVNYSTAGELIPNARHGDPDALGVEIRVRLLEGDEDVADLSRESRPTVGEVADERGVEVGDLFGS